MELTISIFSKPCYNIRLERKMKSRLFGSHCKKMQEENEQ